MTVTLVLFSFFQEGCTVLEKEREEILKKKVNSLSEFFQITRSCDQRAAFPRMEMSACPRAGSVQAICSEQI
jgi:hypothetical protein